MLNLFFIVHPDQRTKVERSGRRCSDKAQNILESLIRNVHLQSPEECLTQVGTPFNWKVEKGDRYLVKKNSWHGGKKVTFYVDEGVNWLPDSCPCRHPSLPRKEKRNRRRRKHESTDEALPQLETRSGKFTVAEFLRPVS